MKQFLAELKRRQLYRFGVIYLAAAWLLMQVAVSIEEPLNLPEWVDTLVITLLAIGFPITLIVAWMLESRTRAAAAPEHGAPVEDGPGDARSRNARGEIRFCTTPSGHRLAYTRLGSGPAVLKTANWLSHQEFDWHDPMIGPLQRDLASHFDVTSYDGRGTGLSDRRVSEFSIDTMLEDMEVVADENRLDRFAIFAYSQSCAVSIAYAVRHPERVSRMVLYGGFASNFRTPEEIEAIATLFAQSWGTDNAATRQIFTSALYPDATKEEFDAFNELQRRAIEPASAAQLFRACHADSMDVRELCGQVAVPTLVLHSRDEPGVPVECGRAMAAMIPGARFVPLASRNHLILQREPAYQDLMDEVVDFLS